MGTRDKKQRRRRGGDGTDPMDAEPSAPPMPSDDSVGNPAATASAPPAASPQRCCHSRECPGKEVCDPNEHICRKRAKRTNRTIEELKAECEARNIPTKYEFPYKRGHKNQEKNKHALQHCLRQRPRNQEDLDRKDRLLAAYLARMEENGLSFSSPSEAQAALASVGIQVDSESLRRHFENRSPPPPPGGPPPPGNNSSSSSESPPPPPPRMPTRSQTSKQGMPAPGVQRPFMKRTKSQTRAAFPVPDEEIPAPPASEPPKQGRKGSVLDAHNPRPTKKSKPTPSPQPPPPQPASERRQTRSQTSKQDTPAPSVQHPPMKKTAKPESRTAILSPIEEEAPPPPQPASERMQTRSQTSKQDPPMEKTAKPKSQKEATPPPERRQTRSQTTPPPPAKKRSVTSMNSADMEDLLVHTSKRRQSQKDKRTVHEKIGAIKRARVDPPTANLGTRPKSKRPKHGKQRSMSFNYNDEESEEEIMQKSEPAKPSAKEKSSQRRVTPGSKKETSEKTTEPEKRKRKSRIPKNAKVNEDENESDASQMIKDISPQFTEGEFIVIDAAGGDDDETRLGVPLPDPQPSVNPYKPGYVYAGWFDHMDGDHLYFEPLIDAHIYNGRRTNRSRDIERYRVITSRELINGRFFELMNGRINHVDSVILRKKDVAKTNNGLPQDLILEIQQAYPWELKSPEDNLQDGSDDFMDNA